MRVRIAALALSILIAGLFAPTVAAEPDVCTPPRGEVRFCSEDYGCDFEQGTCRYYTYCLYVFETVNCTYT